MPKVVKVILTIIISLIIICGGLFAASIFLAKLDIKPVVEIEAGEEIKLLPELFCESSMSQKDISKVEIGSELVADEDKYTYDYNTSKVVSKGMEYLKAGEYQIDFYRGFKEEHATLRVVDTTAPVIVEIDDTHYQIAGVGMYDFSSMIDVDDYSDFSVEIDSSSVNFDKPGTYKIKFVATDIFNNRSEKEVNFEIRKESDNPKSTSSDNPKTDNETKITGIIKQPQIENLHNNILPNKTNNQETQKWRVEYYYSNGYDGIFKDGKDPNED